MTVLFAALAALIVLLGAQGLRMACDPQVGDLFDASEGSSEGEDERLGPFTRLTDLLGSFSQRLLLNIYGDKRVRRLAWQLRAAGRPVGLTAQSFIQREAGFVTVGLILMLLSVLNGRIFYGIVLFVVFALWMHVWLWSAIRKRQEEIERDLPDFLDVFSVTVAAGLPFRVALRRVADEHAGPLAEEMSLTLREMQMGVTRRASLEGLRERLRLLGGELHVSQRTEQFIVMAAVPARPDVQ